MPAADTAADPTGPDDPGVWADVQAAYEAGRSLRECARIAGCAPNTVTRRATSGDWARPESLTGDVEKRRAQTEAAAAAASRRWALRRIDEADSAGDAAASARKRVVELLAGTDAAMLRAAVVAYGILVDKAQLLSGEATSRVDVGDLTPDERRRRVEHLADELAERRARIAGAGRPDAASAGGVAGQ